MRRFALIGSRQRNAENETASEFSNSDRDLNVTSSMLATSPQLFKTRGKSSAAPIDFPSLPEMQLGRHNSIADSTFTRSNSLAAISSHSEDLDILGLQLLCDNSEPAGDIIFVHGLGGTALRTWSWKRDVANFWPAWLADEEELSTFRIFSFGYNSNFKGAATNLNTIDFAKDLLFSLLTFSGGVRDRIEDRMSIGSKPIIFVAHSMGGLVVKKAYVLGKHDKQYSSLIAQVYGILFLATPHRGAQYAKMLNNILSTAPLGAAPKAYVAELDTQSSSLQDINEQFRICCEELQLASFFETRKTSFGVTKLLIVEKESGILGYPQETSMPLNADHHSICKFENPMDANYVTVKNILKHWASGLRKLRLDTTKHRQSSNIDLKQLEVALGIRGTAEADLTALRNKTLDGTCQWIITKQGFVNWIESAPSITPNIFWLVGLPATGKTALSKSVIEHLKFHDQDCAYHFFSSNHQLKRTAAYCLRSIAFQLAQINDEFREQLSTLIEDSGIQFNSQTQSFNLIWEKVFEGILFKLRLRKPLFLILDGINEADSQDFLGCIMKIQSLVPIKLFLTSRPMKIPSTSVANFLTTFFLHEEDTADDIRTYVHNVVSTALPDDPEFQGDIINQVLAKASGSFLWVKVVLETLQDNWHTKEDIQNVLTEVPKGMESLYQQMLDTVKHQSPRLQHMAKRILTWAICCWRPLTVAELQIALQPEFQGFVRLEHTIVQICGHFIDVEDSVISLLHGTTRSFLLNDIGNSPPFIIPREGHEHLAIVCLKYLSSDNWRIVLKEDGMAKRRADHSLRQNELSVIEKSHPLLGYATVYWAYHVSKSSSRSEELRMTLEIFLNKYSLAWIEAIAVLGNLRYLTRSAQYLKAYAKKRSRGSNVDLNNNLLSLREPPSDNTANIFESWANDFIHVVGKFGRNLVQHPPSIYRLVPPFCPQQSIIGTTYKISDGNAVSVAGLPPEGWGDCLASVNVGEDMIASKVLATDAYFITLICSNGTAVVWYAETCEEARRLHHKEYVLMMMLNKAGTRLVTAGISTYRVWDISSGKEQYCLPKLTEGRTMAVSFGPTDSELIIGLDDCSVTTYDLTTLSIKSRWVARDSLQELQGCPSVMAISPDLKKVAIAWRGNPLMVWDMTQSLRPQRCKITGSSDALSAPEQVKWQMDGNSILILCLGTEIFEWNLYDEEQIQHGRYHDINAREMTISADGGFLLTSDNFGTMSIWTFPRMQLIYRLVNGNEFIRDITFSPSGQRFYDTRDSMCNVWEPDALVRPDEHDLEDVSSMAESFAATEPVISQDESSENQVTAFAAGPDDKYYCCGKEDGTVVIHEAVGGTKVRKVCGYSATSTVISLVWSKSGRYIVSSDDSGRVISKRLEVKEAGKWAIFPVLDIRISEAVEQFVFSNDEKLLLISTPSREFVWDIKGKKELCSRRSEQLQLGKWIADPRNAEMLLLVYDEIVCPYKWTTLECSDSSHPPLSDFAPPNDPKGTVRKLALTKDGRNLVYEVVPPQSSDGLQIYILATSSLSHSWKVELSCQVKRLIGTFQDRIVFLDKDYWLCTWEIDAGSSDVKRHFFLPKNWLNTSTLQMATLNDQGTFFCPKFGKVIIVRNGVR
ncbi:hypothetical protein V493_02446 [Pseudogymnoascus sp. VKM F-4281 (FW-2241)]|nr:hypothetical protein V493_02446 [Pseudogymnoascus sp. VKM F-4281 (FW-2241)]